MEHDIALIVLGYGGIGSNIELLTGCNIYKSSKDLCIDGVVALDFDKVEFSNLNRSNFFVNDIGSYKSEYQYKVTTYEEFVDAMFDIVNEKNKGYCYKIKQLVKSVANKEALTPKVLRELKIRNHVYIIDCRDTFAPEAIWDGIDFKLTYDGAYTVRIEYNPYLFAKDIFNYDGDIRYTTTPSFITPPLYAVERLIQLIRHIEYLPEEERTNLRSNELMHFQEHINLQEVLDKAIDITKPAEETTEEVSSSEVVEETAPEAPKAEEAEKPVLEGLS